MNKLIQRFGGEARWVNWNYKLVKDSKGVEKLTKAPIGKSNDPSTWSKLSNLHNQEKIGFMFGLDKTFLGIDIDKFLKDGEIDHLEKENILSIIEKSNTYTELSPSGNGIHLYFELSDPLELKANKKEPYECYTEKRFFTVTGNSYGEEKDIRTITSEEAIEILSIAGYPWGKIKKEKEFRSTPVVENFDDEQVLNKMFGAKNGSKVSSLYNAENISDISSADVFLCSTLAFYTGRNAEQIERIWMSSPLGQREKTQRRKDYRDRTISYAIDNCEDVYEPRQKITKVQEVINEDEFEDIDFDFLSVMKGAKNPQKVPTLCTENICRILRKHPKFKGRYRIDLFKNKYEILENGKWKDFEDKDVLDLQSQIAIMFQDFQTVKKDMVYDACLLVGHENRIDSAADYLKTLVWDKKDRLNTWLCHTYGVEDNIYHQAVGSNWVKGIVDRIISPGCKFDYVLVLEGEQGTKKSSSLAVLGGNWHVETTMSTDSKDFFMQFTAKAIVEFSEGETLSRTEVKRMKAIITTQSDKFRPPYGRVSVDFPRRCVFAMTTNTSEYLKDETGNRRWWPVETKLPEANIEWLKQNRDQLFAEAYERVVNKKENTWEVPKEETRAAQDARRISDPNEELVIDWYFNVLKDSERMEGITVHQVNAGAFGNSFGGSKSLKKFEEANITNILKRILNLENKQVMRSGIRTNRWYPINMPDSEMVESLSPYAKLSQF